MRLNLQLILDLRLTCEYDLTLYPFDVQECGFTLNLGAELTGDTHWEEGNLAIFKSLPQPALYGAYGVRLSRVSKTKVRWVGWDGCLQCVVCEDSGREELYRGSLS